MEITRNGGATTKGLPERFTGDVFIDTVATPSGPSRMSASCVHFTPGARTAWHRHPLGQTLYVVEGVGVAQGRGGPAEIIRAGDRATFAPGEDHWHGASAHRLMTHIAMQEVDDTGNNAVFGDLVTDEEYAASTSTDGA